MTKPRFIEEFPPRFYEFFAGGGMARLGLGRDWRCVFANDYDKRKAETYHHNFDRLDEAHYCPSVLNVNDVHLLHAHELPSRVDLAWASFPCQDLSLAGQSLGIADGRRSSAFFGFMRLMRDLFKVVLEPKVIVLENVPGLLTSNGGDDFTAVCESLHSIGYCFGAMMIDAVNFVPQSRPRVFIVATRHPLSGVDQGVPPDLFHPSPFARNAKTFFPPAIQRAFSRLPVKLKEQWVWWRLPDPPGMTASLSSIIDEAAFDAAASGDSLYKEMSWRSKLDVEQRSAHGGTYYGTAFRRTRPGGVQLEARFDGLAGCLRTPVGGSSRQLVLKLTDGKMKARLFTPRECARLMGLPESYRLPTIDGDAYHLLGDGVVVPVVRFLSENLLLPLVNF